MSKLCRDPTQLSNWHLTVGGESDNLGFSPGSSPLSCVSQGILYSLSLSAHLQRRENELGHLLDEEGLSTVGGRHCHQCVRSAPYRPVGCSKYSAQCSVLLLRLMSPETGL